MKNRFETVQWFSREDNESDERQRRLVGLEAPKPDRQTRSFAELTHSALFLVFLVAVSALTSGCIVGGSVSQLQTDDIGSSGVPVTSVIERESMVVGSAFDFRAVRLVSALDMRTLSPKPETRSTLVKKSSKADYGELRMMRLDLPLLSLWDFESGGVGYPGVLPHRHTIDVWARGGTSNADGDYELFYGGALTYYRAGGIAVTLTADRWGLETEVTTLENIGQVVHQGDATGWAFGIEVTLFAGEYALDIFSDLWALDKSLRDGSR